MNFNIIINGKTSTVNLSYMKDFVKVARKNSCKIELIKSWPYEHAPRILITRPDGKKSGFFFQGAN